MSTVKNEKTKIYLGSGKPAEATLAAAIAAAAVGFGCTITTMDGLEKSRGTSSDDAVYCADSDSFNPDDTDEMKVSNFTASGYVDDDSPDYDAVEALANEMIGSDTQGTLVIVEPDGTSKLWMEVKVIKWAIKRGGAKDKKRFDIEFLPRTMPKDV